VKIALVSSDGSGCWFLLRLIEEGNSCDYYLLDKDKTARVLSGMVPSPIFEEPKSWRQYDLVFFDGNSDGELADKIRKQTNVLGCSELSCKLEDDRLFGFETMEQMGIDVPAYEAFDSPEEARKHIAAKPDRYVYKPFQEVGALEVDCSVTYVAHSPSDMERNLDGLFQKSGGAPFVLQKFVEGTELSIEAWFDGTQFHFVNATLEEKKFLAGNLGPNIGCAGNLVWPFQNIPLAFTRGLARGREWLRDHDYRGMIDLNSIVTRNHVYGLEWTPRCGYHATASLLNLLNMPLADFLIQFAAAPEGGINAETRTNFNFGTAIDISVPPFPCSTAKAEIGLMVDGVDPDQAWRETYLYDAQMHGNELVTAGVNGDIGAVLARGNTFRGAWENALEMVRKVKAPNLQWRVDLEQSTGKRYKKLKSAGWL
jgi:phosphoribosylamine-glycine ligase